MNKKEGIKLCESELKVMELLWEEGELRAGEIVPIVGARWLEPQYDLYNY